MPSSSFQLTAARLTAGGRGAVATVRICAHSSSGDQQPLATACPLSSLDMLFAAANCRPIAEQLLTKIVFGKWGQSDSEEVVLCRLKSDIVEIHCHGGEAAIQRVLRDLSGAGCLIVDWRDQVKASQGVIDAECHEVLSQTSTWRTTRIALEQAGGLLKLAFLKLNELSTQDDNAFRGHVVALLRWSTLGVHLSTPWNVVLTGRPNVGKSSLLNALLGYQRAIVFDQPGTTRDVVTGETALDGWPFALSDTAGIRDSVQGIEAAGIALARQRLNTADLRLLLIDISESPTADDDRLLHEWPDALIVAHKADQPDYWGDRLPKESIRVSSMTGMGMAELQQRIVNRLVPNVPEPGTAMPVTVRQVDLLKRIQQSQTTAVRQQLIQELFAEPTVP